jgi:hypothetical protein
MPRQHLTDIAIKQLANPESGDVKYWDTVVLSFGVRVTARTKSFFVVQGEKRKLTTFAKYPETSLQDARKQAKRLLATDAPEKRTTSLTAAATAYLADAQPRLRAATYSEYSRYLKLVSGVCQTSCPPISCGISDFGGADIAFRVQPDGSGRLPVAGFS